MKIIKTFPVIELLFNLLKDILIAFHSVLFNLQNSLGTLFDMNAIEIHVNMQYFSTFPVAIVLSFF